MKGPRFAGIIPPLVTPLADEDELDVAGLERLVEHVLAGGVNGLFLLGTTGEGPALSYRLRAELVERVVKQVAGRTAVLVGISDTSLAEQLRFAELCAAKGATALVMAPPYYFPLNRMELTRHIDTVAARAPLPLVLYNMPSHTKTALDIDVVRAAMERENVVGIKDSSGELIYFQSLLAERAARRPDWSVLMGPEELLAEAVLLGADGGVSGGANVLPQLYVELFAAACAGELGEVRRLQALVWQFSSHVYRLVDSPNSVILGAKEALGVLGICSPRTALPVAALQRDERAALAAFLRALK